MKRNLDQALENPAMAGRFGYSVESAVTVQTPAWQRMIERVGAHVRFVHGNATKNAIKAVFKEAGKSGATSIPTGEDE